MVQYFFIAASCTSKIASVIHFGVFFILSDNVVCKNNSHLN